MMLASVYKNKRKIGDGIESKFLDPIVGEGQNPKKFLDPISGDGLATQTGDGLSLTGIKNFANRLSRSKYKQPLFPGEHHVPLYDRDQKLAFTNFLGPGTQISKRLTRGDVPINKVDEFAKEHDIAYMKSEGIQNPVERKKFIRAADKKLIFETNQQPASIISPAQKVLVNAGIGSKIGLEKIGLPVMKKFEGGKKPDPVKRLRKEAKKKLTKQYARILAKKIIK
jgi:hypothetical protein